MPVFNNMISVQYIYLEQQFPNGGQIQRSDIIVDFSSFILIYSQQCKLSDRLSFIWA